MMSGSGYGSRKKAILAAQEAMRASFGSKVSFESIQPAAPFPRAFRVLDEKGLPIQGFSVFKTGITIQEWAWQETTPELGPGSELDG
jgi:hypothetical protein